MTDNQDSAAPDFEVLRAKRNKRIDEWEARIRADGWATSQCIIRDKNSCYCDCANGGPCEHKWDGEPYESTNRAIWSTTCSRCGMTSYSHSLHSH